MLLRNLLALEHIDEFRIRKTPPAPAPVVDDPTASELRTNPARRFTQKIQVAEQRQLLRAERLVINTYHRNNAVDFEREHYRALGVI